MITVRCANGVVVSAPRGPIAAMCRIVNLLERDDDGDVRVEHTCPAWAVRTLFAFCEARATSPALVAIPAGPSDAWMRNPSHAVEAQYVLDIESNNPFPERLLGHLMHRLARLVLAGEVAEWMHNDEALDIIQHRIAGILKPLTPTQIAKELSTRDGAEEEHRRESNKQRLKDDLTEFYGSK